MTAAIAPADRATEDVIDQVVGIRPGDALDEIRRARPETRDNLRVAYRALFETEADGLALADRHRVAAFVAGLSDPGSNVFGWHRARSGAAEQLDRLLASAGQTGPWGSYREPNLTAESVSGVWWQVSADERAAVGEPLAAVLEHAHVLVLHPRDARPNVLEKLADAGWSRTQIVTWSQLISFVSFQVRVAAGFAVLSELSAGGAVGEPDAAEPGSPAQPTSPAEPASPAPPVGARSAEPARVVEPTGIVRPEGFTQNSLGWVPWLEPVAADNLTERQIEALVQPSRANSPYFRLLADDPDILEARTRADLDIFHSRGGLPRAERELAAAAVSRHNGCVFCASVHARFASHYAKRTDDVQRLLDRGVTAEQDERWSAIVAAAVALTDTPVGFGAGHVRRLRAVGLDDTEITDLVQAAAFFNWANRLMLSLGEPEVVTGERSW